jgi:very-short-patch-repair endonuclease
MTSTEPERRLWYRLRDRRFAGHKFRRQCAIGGYVVDFVCVERRLVIELDGGQHGEQIAHDERRTLFLLTKGLRVLRFWNDEVMQQLDAVLGMIGRELDGGGGSGPSP